MAVSDIDPISYTAEKLLDELLNYAINGDGSLAPVNLSADTLKQIESIVQDQIEKSNLSNNIGTYLTCLQTIDGLFLNGSTEPGSAPQEEVMFELLKCLIFFARRLEYTNHLLLCLMTYIQGYVIYCKITSNQEKMSEVAYQLRSFFSYNIQNAFDFPDEDTLQNDSSIFLREQLVLQEYGFKEFCIFKSYTYGDQDYSNLNPNLQLSIGANYIEILASLYKLAKHLNAINIEVKTPAFNIKWFDDPDRKIYDYVDPYFDQYEPLSNVYYSITIGKSASSGYWPLGHGLSLVGSNTNYCSLPCIKKFSDDVFPDNINVQDYVTWYWDDHGDGEDLDESYFVPNVVNINNQIYVFLGHFSGAYNSKTTFASQTVCVPINVKYKINPINSTNQAFSYNHADHRIYGDYHTTIVWPGGSPYSNDIHAVAGLFYVHREGDSIDIHDIDLTYMMGLNPQLLNGN